ncbi:MAG: terminase small subunit, partial [Flavobacteriaceae bacterium]
PIEVEDNKGTKHVNIVKLKRPYTIKAFLLYVDASSSWLSDFKKNAPEDFLEVIRKIESIIYVQKFEGAAIGIFQHNIIARDLGLIESSKVDHTTRGDKINITFVEK